MKKKGLAIILCLCITLALLPVTTLAGWRAEVYIGDICLSLNDEDDKAYAVVDSAGTVTTDGASESNYDVKFEAVRDPDTYESVATLTLNDFQYTGSGSCLTDETYYSICTAHDIDIILIGNNTAVNLGAESANGSYGIYCGGRLAISGNGSLTAAGGQAWESSGIYVSENSLIIEGGTITATGGNLGDAEDSRSCGIHVYGNVNLQAGTVNATGGTADILSAGFYCDGGDLIISGSSTLTAKGSAAIRSIGIQVDSNGPNGGNLTVEGGTITATGGDLVSEADNYSYGIYAGRSVTVNNGTVNATGGTANKGSYGVTTSPTGTITYQNGVMIAKSTGGASKTYALDSAPALPAKYVWRTSENTNYSQLWSNGYNTIGTAYSYNEELPGTYVELRRVAVYPASLNFGSAVEGYNAPDPQLFWVYNCSDDDVAVDMRQLSDQNDPNSGGNEYSSGYDFGATLPWTISSGGNGACNVRPKTGLAAGTYNETITVSGSNSTGVSTAVTFTVNAAPPVFVPVTDITMTNAASVQVNTDLILAGTVSPANATNKTIVWSVENAGATGATVINGVFKAEVAGTATIKATVTNGATATADYSETFEITVTAVPNYEIIKGANGKWTRGGNSGLSFTANGEFSLFTGVMVNGTLLSTSDYTAVSGSTVVTLKPSYLSMLSVGTNNLTILFNDGEAVTQFEVQDADSSTDDASETGDSSNTSLWLALLFVSGCILATLGVTGKCKNRGT